MGSPRALSYAISKRETMKLRSLVLLAVTSAALLAAGRAEPARRPRYGGTLRVEIGATVNSIDPSVAPQTEQEALARDEICSLLYEPYRPQSECAGAAGTGAF